MSGTRGPVGKRSDERRRTNAPVIPMTVVKPADLAAPVEIPAPDENWHPLARHFYDSLARSGQSRFYEPSDWSLAYLLAESITRDLDEQVVGIDQKTGEVLYAKIPLKGASLAAYLKGFTALMVTEADRRRLSIELNRTTPEEGEGAKVLDLAAERAALVGS